MRTPLLLFALGLWCGLICAAALQATLSFSAASRAAGALAPPEMRAPLQGLPDGQRLQLLRYVAAESNRALFGSLGSVQLALAGAALALAWPLGGGPRLLALALGALLLAQLALVAPSVAALGRSLDFAPRPLPADVARRFGLWHGAYAVAELIKFVLLGATATLAARRVGGLHVRKDT